MYLNCEDFKHHTFPNVLIEILEAIFLELENNLSGWFGRKGKQKEIISTIRTELRELRQKPDLLEEQVTRADSLGATVSSTSGFKVSAGAGDVAVGVEVGKRGGQKVERSETSQVTVHR